LRKTGVEGNLRAMRNLYDILGIPTQASASDIKAAFRKQARDKHPDTNNGARESEDDFKELNRAYAILSDPDQRALYDRGLIDESGATIREHRHKRSNPFEDFIKRRWQHDAQEALPSA